MTKGRPPNITAKTDKIIEEIDLERFFDRRLIFVVKSESSGVKKQT